MTSKACFIFMPTRYFVRFSLFLFFLLLAGAAQAQNCSSFSTCAEAVASYRAGNSKLDRDKDGIPCEKICGKNGENMTQYPPHKP